MGLKSLARSCALICLSLLVASGASAFEAFQPNGNGNLCPANSNGTTTAVPFLNAYRLAEGEQVELDGRLDDGVWSRAESAAGFQMWDPDRGAPANEETVFKVAYDSGNIYFGVAAFEQDIANITSNLARRDQVETSDVISIYVDPYHDKNTGYNFRVNPAGVQVDSYMFNDGNRDINWNAVWDVETYQDEHGWYAEFRIPFRAMRYQPGDEMTWGLQVYRYMHGRGTDTAWVIWPRDLNGFISRFGELRGLRDIPAPRQLEILPYLLTSATDHSNPTLNGDALQNNQNFGADFKYGVTADLTLNATVNPDFGQVEADPATLNLSPFETFFEEKRPFFVEGSRFFQHPDFNLFYSRRIGTGNALSRIPLAAKLTGKTRNKVSIGALVAATDVARDGSENNLFRSAGQKSMFAVGRFGKEFNDANQRFNVMGTAAVKSADRLEFGDRASREAYTAGMDFDLFWKDRDYNIQGSVVGSFIHPEAVPGDPSVSTDVVKGSGGNVDLRKVGGTVQGGTWFRWESDKLDINDLGFLSAPDEYGTGAWLSYRYSPDGESKMFNRGNLNFNYWKSWLFAGRQGFDVENPDQEVWAYSGGHNQWHGGNVNGWIQFRNYYEAWMGIDLSRPGTAQFVTRGVLLMDEPTTYGGWLGGGTDYRKKFRVWSEVNYFRDTVANRSYNISAGGRWNQSSAINHSIEFGYRNRTDDTQYLETVRLSDRPGGMGIGGLSYVFGAIYQRTYDVTLRSNLLFNRNMSLELYLQPFITVGDYSRARELVTPDSYDLVDYNEPGYDVTSNDFSFSAVNLNAVYRWQFRPGSTLFLVWTHARNTYDQREFHSQPENFSNRVSGNTFFRNEPENLLMAKLSYYFAL